MIQDVEASFLYSSGKTSSGLMFFVFMVKCGTEGFGQPLAFFAFQ